MTDYKAKRFPATRIATIDIGAVGKRKHHIAAFLEVDVSDSRAMIRKYRREKGHVSLTAWLLKVIAGTIKDYEEAASFLNGKRRLVIFDDINISIVVEKNLEGHKVPIPLVIEKADKRSVESISRQIEDARQQVLDKGDIVLQKSSGRLERLYYVMPGFLRRMFWRLMLRNPRFAFSKMGNVSVTSVGAMGQAKGWFLPISVHPVCFGLGRVMKKPLVIDDEIKIREILNMTVLIDHDVIDGANMARFLGELTERIERGRSFSDSPFQAGLSVFFLALTAIFF